RFHVSLSFFFFNAPATPASYTLSLHDALPISLLRNAKKRPAVVALVINAANEQWDGAKVDRLLADKWARQNLIANVLIQVEKNEDRKSTRLNSSHLVISYAVFCLKKKTIVHRP